MFEARIILPQNDNQGREISAVNKLLASRIVSEFGGVTVTLGHGMWKDPKGRVVAEAVVVYDIAVVPGAATEYALEQIAAEACINAGQECVYLRYPDGEVVFVEAAHHAAHREAA